MIRCLVLFATLLPAMAGAAPPAELEQVLADLEKDRVFKQCDVGVQVVDLETGEEVWSMNADTALSPASTTKVLTAATALKTLGPAFRWSTIIATDAQPDGEGAVKGNVYLRGSGDPTMVVEKLWKMVVDLRLSGVSKIDGDLVFDETYFEVDYALPGWTKAEDIERGPAYFPPLSALSINFNTVAIVVRPGPEVGKPARVVLETPAGEHVTLSPDVTTSAAGRRRSIRVVREVREDGGMVFAPSGTMPLDGKSARYYRTVSDPTAHFMAITGALFAQQGIEITGELTRGPTPEDAVVVVENQSPPLAAALMDMNKFSSNYIAEHVLRTVGSETSDKPGTTAAGLLAMDTYLRSLGLTDADFTLVNGSGLSRDARVTPAALTAVLMDMDRDPEVGAEFAASLAIAGWDGTLARRLEENPAGLRGKTGTIGGVHCLTGYVTAGTGDRYAFAFLVNRISGGAGQVRALHDRFARKLFDLDDGSAPPAAKAAAEAGP